MNAYIFIFALICKATAFEEHNMEHCDVGTVLFSRTALNKRSWTVSQISLLRARKHFLDLIPPIHVLNTRSEDFTNNMLTYFKESFAEVKREVQDVETDHILTLALSDAIGGYLKMWVLPITKFAYYGGSVPKEDALKLYQFQENLKKYLKTDGKGWRNPTTDFLYSMSVNIAPIRHEYTRNTQYPCDDIAYFERTVSGLAIPMPSISWDKGFECMFFPIKNQSPLSLNQPDPSDTLLKYFNIARYCIITSNLEDLDNYSERFQKWLDINIIPHLKDEKIYPALRSVLSLVNKTKIFDATEELYQPLPNKTYIGGIPVDLSSKKMMVISVIIILEIAWCIPTLCYLMFTRIKNKRNKLKMYYCANDKKNSGNPAKGDKDWNRSAGTITNQAQMLTKQISASPSVQSRACVNELKRCFDVDVETCFPKASQNTIGTATRSNFKCQLRPAQITMNHEAINQKPSRHVGVPVSKSVSIKISDHSSSDKALESNARPHLTPAYDSTLSKTSVNSFTRYKIKRPSSHNAPCCNKMRSSSTMKGSWCSCIRTSSSVMHCSACQLDSKTDNSSALSKKDSSTFSKLDSSIFSKNDSSTYNKNESATSIKKDSASFSKKDSMSLGKKDSASFGKKESVSFTKKESVSFAKKESVSFAKKESVSFAKKDSASFGKNDSASSLIKTTFCNCKRDSSSFIKSSCSESNCECFNCIPEEDMASTTGSLITVQNLQPTQTVTLLHDSVQSVNNPKVSSYIHFAGSEKKEPQNTNKEEKKIKKTVTISSVASTQELARNTTVEQKTTCKIGSSYKLDNNRIDPPHKVDKGTKKCVTIVSLSSSQDSSDQALKCSKQPPNKEMQSLAIEKASKETMYADEKISKPDEQNESIDKKDLKSSTPLLRISIDRTFPPKPPERSARPSKIPKRFFTSPITQIKYSKAAHSYRKSFIPQRKKHITLDDTAIQNKHSSYSPDTDKLNVTL